MSDQPSNTAARRKTNPILRVLIILVLGMLFVGAGLYGRARLTDYADPIHLDPTPLPRVPKNAPFIKSADSVVDAMVELGNITDQDMVYDLGCGDGKIVITAAVQTGCRGIGFDIDLERVAEANENVKLHEVEKLVTIKQEDVFLVDLREANVIVMYLLPWMIQKLVAQFDQCPPGTRIVSHDFKIENVKEEKMIKVAVEGNSEHYVFLYVTPLKKETPPAKKFRAVLE